MTNLIGVTFGYRTVLEETPARTYSGGKMLLCKCSCGQVDLVSKSHLLTGLAQSCKNCYHKRPKKKQGPAHNRKPFGEAQLNLLYSRYKQSAIKRGLSFELSKEEFKQITSASCEYCGQKPKQVASKLTTNGEYIYNGIDRVDNKLGYRKDNCVPCCKFCNRAKDTLTKEEFMDKIKDIWKHAVEYYAPHP